MKADDRVRLRHIADALSAVIRFTEGRSREDLDRMKCWLSRYFTPSRLWEKLRVSSAPNYGTSIHRFHGALITGMRHRLVHAYFDINYDILWTTATESVPELRAQADGILASD